MKRNDDMPLFCPAPAREVEIARIEAVIKASECELDRQTRCGLAPSDHLVGMADRLESARQKLEDLRRDPPREDVADARRLIGRWAGNLDPAPEPRRPPPTPFGEER